MNNTYNLRLCYLENAPSLRTLMGYSVNDIQQNEQTYQYTFLYLKHYAPNMFGFVMDHLQGGTTSINYV